MKLISIPFNMPFLEIVARKWMEESALGKISFARKGIILVPNQRTAKALIETFLKITNGKPILLPRIMSIGNIDDSAFILQGSDHFTLFPAVDLMQRNAVLTSLIMKMNQALGRQEQAGEVWKLATSLGELMDEAEWADCDLKKNLPNAVDNEYAQHWQNILQFLTIITDVWPQWLQDNQLMNPVARKIAMLRAQAVYWRSIGSDEPVWAIGFFDARPAVIELLSAIIGLTDGKLIISGLQDDLSEDVWERLPLTHPYAELSQMLIRLHLKRSDFTIWNNSEYNTVPTDRIYAFQQALLPAENLNQWLENQIPIELSGCFLTKPVDQQQEAVSIALMIRDALENPEVRVALVTPDRNLAMRVVLELGRWEVIADDSAGEPLYKTPAAILLSLILQVCIENWTQVSLLSLLKHPLVRCGYEPNHCRIYTRQLEVNILRPFAVSGLSLIIEVLEQKIDYFHISAKGQHQNIFKEHARNVLNLLYLLQAAFTPLFNGEKKRPLSEWILALVEVAESLTTNAEQVGELILWGGEEGNALAEHLRNLIIHTDCLDDISLQDFESILSASYTGILVHGRRAVRGKINQKLHPRVYIWGLIEARLQTVDRIILGGLCETVWPPVVDSGPWLSRLMRAKIDIPLPDAEVGRSAYDFLSICCSVPQVILSSPLRKENAPVVQSRWITRLNAWLEGRQSMVSQHPSLEWAKELDQPLDAPCPIVKPEPKPPVAWRPKTMSITDIERWLKDPYEIYAKHILKLSKMAGLDEDRSASIFGNIVHDGLNHAYQQLQDTWDKSILERCLLAALAERRDIIPSLRRWWHARILRVAEWVYQQEKYRRQNHQIKHIYTEKEGRYDFSQEEGLSFTIRGIADRIDVLQDGTIDIFDYKTGNVPSLVQVRGYLFPQLPLEAAMLHRGAFGVSLKGLDVTELYYWQLKGDMGVGKEIRIANPVSGRKVEACPIPQLAQGYWDRLKKLIMTYNNPNQAYLSRPRPMLFDAVSGGNGIADYAHLSRILEWGSTEGDE